MTSKYYYYRTRLVCLNGHMKMEMAMAAAAAAAGHAGPAARAFSATPARCCTRAQAPPSSTAPQHAANLSSGTSLLHRRASRSSVQADTNILNRVIHRQLPRRRPAA